MVKKSQICVSRLLEALFVVTEKYSQAKTDGGQQKKYFDTYFIDILWK